MAESLFNNSASWEMYLMEVYVVMDISAYWCNYRMSLILFLQGIGLWSFIFFPKVFNFSMLFILNVSWQDEDMKNKKSRSVS